jgi:hypothetical protein
VWAEGDVRHAKEIKAADDRLQEAERMPTPEELAPVRPPRISLKTSFDTFATFFP